eukprot:7047716-Prymnesium_polylepis.1
MRIETSLVLLVQGMSTCLDAAYRLFWAGAREADDTRTGRLGKDCDARGCVACTAADSGRIRGMLRSKDASKSGRRSDYEAMMVIVPHVQDEKQSLRRPSAMRVGRSRRRCPHCL